MSVIKVNYVVNKTEDGPVELSQGASVPVGKTLDVQGETSVTGTLSAGSMSVTGNMTATGNISGNLSGDGSNLVVASNPSVGKIMAIKRILGYDEFRA